jgi:hypothetical protein
LKAFTAANSLSGGHRLYLPGHAFGTKWIFEGFIFILSTDLEWT